MRFRSSVLNSPFRISIRNNVRVSTLRYVAESQNIGLRYSTPPASTIGNPLF